DSRTELWHQRLRIGGLACERERSPGAVQRAVDVTARLVDLRALAEHPVLEIVRRAGLALGDEAVKAFKSLVPAPQQVRGACHVPSQPASSRGVAVELRGSQSLVEELGSASEFEVEEGLHGEVVDDRAGLRRARGEGDLEPLLHIGDALAVAEIVLR